LIHSPQPYNRLVSVYNSTSTPLANGATYTGTTELVPNFFSCVIVAIKSDQDCSYYLDFSTDGVNFDSSVPYKFNAGTPEAPKRLDVARAYFRLRIVNDSGSDQTYLRAQTTFGNFPLITSTLNSVVNQDADAIITRSSFDKKAIALGLFENTSRVTKAGLNSDVDTGSVPEDVNETGGLYLGFPSTGEPLRALSDNVNDTSAGTGARTISAQAMDENYNWIGITFTLNGKTPVAPDAPYDTTNFIRCHTASTLTAGSGGENAGTLTVRHATTTTNVFLTMPVGRNQTNNTAYTIPAGYNAVITNLRMAIAQGTTSASAEGFFRVRTFGSVWRNRRPLLAQNTYPAEDLREEYLTFSEKTDMIMRVTFCSNNNTIVLGRYYVYLFKA